VIASPPPGRVLVTGATGCVGSHVMRELHDHTSYDLVAVARAPERMPPWTRALTRVTTLASDLRSAAREVTVSAPFDRAILLAASWKEEPDASEVNVEATLSLVDALISHGCPHIAYVSTASLLDRQGVPLAAADAGTPYIRSKLVALRRIRSLQSDARITTVFPTIVAGDGDGAPASQAAIFLRAIAQRAWVLRWLSAEGSFHAIHPADLARIIRQLVTRAPLETPANVLAGGAAIAVDDAIADILRLVRRRRLGKFALSRGLLDALLRVFRVQLSAWDRYCLAQRHFVYDDAVATLEASEPARYPTFGDVCRAVLASDDRRAGISARTMSGASSASPASAVITGTSARD
jgi:nucleoside-diphosphate-sugar epimerase